MADVLVDTDVFIDHLRGLRRLEVPLRKLVSYSVITRCEILAGKGSEETVIRRLLAAPAGAWPSIGQSLSAPVD